MKLNKFLLSSKIILILCFMSFIEMSFPVGRVPMKFPAIILILLFFIFIFSLRFILTYFLFREILRINASKKLMILLAYPLFKTDVVINNFKIETPFIFLLKSIYDSILFKMISTNPFLMLFMRIFLNMTIYDVWRFLLLYFYCKNGVKQS